MKAKSSWAAIQKLCRAISRWKILGNGTTSRVLILGSCGSNAIVSLRFAETSTSGRGDLIGGSPTIPSSEFTFGAGVGCFGVSWPRARLVRHRAIATATPRPVVAGVMRVNIVRLQYLRRLVELEVIMTDSTGPNNQETAVPSRWMSFSSGRR